GSYRISRSSFVGNSNAGGPGGAVSLSQGTEFVIDRSSFAGNYVTADAAGGAIYGASLDGATLRVSGCVFTGNEARYTGASAANSDGGAIAIIGASGAGAAVEIYGCSFKDNRAGDDGGAVMLEGPALRARIVNSTFSGNSCAGALDTAAGGHDGSGGAVKLLSMQQSEIVHCTFYANEAALGIGGNLGGGGAVACQAGPGGAGAPVLVNNIFIANISTPAGRGNVYLAPGCDAGAANTGNVGLDNGMPGFSNGESPADGIIAAELFADIEAGRALPHYYGEPVGSSGNTVQRFCYIVGPRIDEMYALGQRPAYREDIPDDALGMRRDREPSAGAAENHWIKYDPGSAKGGFWASAPSGAVKALRSDAYYFSWKEGEPGLTALLGSFLGAPMPGAAFMGWQSDQPEDPAAAEPQYPTVLPGDDVKASKQTYTAIWRIGYKVEFDLRYGGLMLAPLTDVPAGSTISAPSAPARPGYTFTGWRKGAGADAAGWSFDIDTVNADTVLYASWVWNPGVGSGDASNPGARPGGSTGSSTGPSGGAPVGTGTADQGQGATQPDTAGQADPQAPDPQTPAPTDPQTPAPVGPQAPAVPDAVPETPPVVEYPVSDQVYTGNAGTTASNAGSNSNNSSGNNAGTAATGAGSGASVIGAGNADSAGGDESDGEEGIYGGAFGFQTEPPVEQPGLGGLGGSDITETPFTPPTSTESDAGSLIPEFTSTTEDYTLPQTLRLVFNNLPALLHSRYGDDIPIISVFEARVPLVGRNGEIALSFLNCLLMILALLLPVLVFFGNLRKRREQTELGYAIEKGFKPLCIILAIGAGLLSVLTFFITQDIYARVILIDRWTVLMGIILLISAVMSVLARYQSTEDRIGISSTKIM
ncbi:MAG: InlB B-repeat-containing protein, partial [Clostridiales Family XIII bacterium]|nr:InlB B-repeat-containing protein [Clostridiales Family XIII bacterium]